MDKYFIAHIVASLFIFFISFGYTFILSENQKKMGFYRTPRAVKSQDTKQEAHQFISKIRPWLGVSTLFIQVVFYISLDKAQALLATFMFLGMGIFCMIILTEIHLSRTFDDNGDYRIWY